MENCYKKVDQFKYLGSTRTKYGTSVKEVQIRLMEAHSAMTSSIFSLTVITRKSRHFTANPLNIFVHLQLLWPHNAYQFKDLLHLLPFGSNLKGEFWRTPNLGVWVVRGELVDRELCQSKAHPWLPNTSPQYQYKVLPPFGHNSNVKLWPSN